MVAGAMTEAGVKRRRRLRVLEPPLMREVFPRLARVRTTMQILEMLKP